VTKGSISQCVESFAVDVAVTQFAAVVQGAADGSCALPSEQNVEGFVGFTQAAQSTVDDSVAVMTEGVSAAYSGGDITRGHKVAINSAAGDVYDVDAAIEAGLATPAAVIHVIGEARNSVTGSGKLVYIKIRPFVVALAVS
jgi:hypothetical protein